MLLGLLLVILIFVCIALVGVILLQQSEGGALGMGGGPSGFLTARGAGDLLTRTTSILAAAFFLLCISLTVLSGRLHGGGSVVDRLKVDALNPDALNLRPAKPAVAPGQPAPLEAPRPEVHTAPAAGASGGTNAALTQALPTSAPTSPPTSTGDNGASSPVTRALGVQSAPQAAPTTAAPATASKPAPASRP